MMIRLSLGLTAAVLASDVLVAQKRGFLSTTSSGMVFSQGAPVAGQTLTKAPGVGRSLNEFPVKNTLPDFRHDVMFGSLAGDVELDAISTGNDRIPINGRNRISPNNAWVFIGYSVTQTANGTPNSYINSVRNQPQGPGGELLGYYLPGSVGLPQASWEGNILLEHSAADISNVSTSTPVELSGFDHTMKMMLDANGGTDPILFAQLNQFFFSVTPASAFDLGGSWHAANVYRIEWNTQSGRWSTPTVFRSFADLGLGTDENVDALAIDTWAPGPTRVIFSTEYDDNATVQRAQILLENSNGAIDLELETDPTNPGPNTGIPLPDVLDLDLTNEQDDIDSLCVGDPEFSSTPLLSTFMGIALDPLDELGNIVGVDHPHLNVGRSEAIYDGPITATSIDQSQSLTIQLSGWADNVSQAGFVVLAESINGGAFVAGAPEFRPATQNIVEWTIPLPSVIPNGFVVDYIAAFVPISGAPVQSSNRSRIRIPTRL